MKAVSGYGTSMPAANSVLAVRYELQQLMAKQ
jgi:hypothetical protein